MFDFPASPAIGTEVSNDGAPYRFDGVKWVSAYATASPTDPLMITATGSTMPRSMQDREADVANVLDFGADPTGAAYSTAAFQGAAATGKRIYIPRGHYKVTDASTVIGGQIIYGDGPRSTLIDVNSAIFNMGARGVFDLAPGTREQDVEIRDLWIRFAQPNFVGMTRADIIHYPPAINSRAGNRAKLVNLQISNAWVGIDFDGGGAGFLDRVEMSAYSVGITFGATTPVLDGTHISNYHWWNFDMTLDQAAVMWDGTSIAADIGRIDGLVASDWIVFKGDINIHDTAGTPGFYYMTNIVMDSTSSTLTISNAFVCEIVNFHSTKGAQETPAILVTGGRVSFTNLAIQSAMVSTAAIQITGGGAQFNGGTPWWKESAGAEFVSVTGGNCTLNNVTFATHIAAHTAPFVHQSGTGFLVMNNCQFPPSGVTGVAIQMDTVVAGNWVGPSNTYGGLGVGGAGFVQPVIGRFNPTGLGAQLVASSMTGALAQEGKLRLLGSFPTGADTIPHLAASLRAGYSSFSWSAPYLNVWLNSASNATNDDANTTQVASFVLNTFTLGNATAPNQNFAINGAAGSGKTIATQTAGLNRWAIQHTTAAETGSNAGANLSIIRFSDAGGSLGTVLQASRANGTVGFNNVAPPAAKPAGYTTPTGTATRATFATDSVTLPVLAEHVKALIDDLTAYGLIGP